MSREEEFNFDPLEQSTSDLPLQKSSVYVNTFEQTFVQLPITKSSFSFLLCHFCDIL